MASETSASQSGLAVKCASARRSASGSTDCRVAMAGQAYARGGLEPRHPHTRDLTKQAIGRPSDRASRDHTMSIAHNGSVSDSALMEALVAEARREDSLSELTAGELEVLALMAEGRSNLGI